MKSAETPENYKPIAPTPSNVNSSYFTKIAREEELLEEIFRATIEFEPAHAV